LCIRARISFLTFRCIIYDIVLNFTRLICCLYKSLLLSLNMRAHAVYFACMQLLLSRSRSPHTRASLPCFSLLSRPLSSGCRCRLWDCRRDCTTDHTSLHRHKRTIENQGTAGRTPLPLTCLHTIRFRETECSLHAGFPLSSLWASNTARQSIQSRSLYIATREQELQPRKPLFYSFTCPSNTSPIS